METTRRAIFGAGLATASALAVPGLLRAQTQPPASRTIRAVLHSDIASYDPIWTSANITAYHGGMVYDMLFGNDQRFEPHPQMVSKYGSGDGLTWTFELRDGLRFSDGTPVTSADVVPSIRRWTARSSSGQLLMPHVKEMLAKDEKTFSIVLKEKFPLLVPMLASSVTPICFIMRKREAETDPMQKIDTVIGSGPFLFNQYETTPGARHVYDRNPNYVPRNEPASGLAGGKLVKIDRVVFENIPDSQTAVAALLTDEIDFYEIPPIDLLNQLQSNPNIVVENIFGVGLVGYIGINWLYPPFDNVKLRQSLLYIVNQVDMLLPTFADPKWFSTCGSYFACGTPLANDANTGWFKQGPNPAMAKQLMKEGGYDGRPVIMLQATNIAYMSNAATVMASEMRQVGYNVQLVPMDWGTVVQRRASMAPSDKGGWNIFFTATDGQTGATPYALGGMATTGKAGWFGWPTDAKNEELRSQWMNAETQEERLRIAREIQDNAWNIVPHLYFGQWMQPAAYRKSTNGWLHMPGMIPFWNVSKS